MTGFFASRGNRLQLVSYKSYGSDIIMDARATLRGLKTGHLQTLQFNTTLTNTTRVRTVTTDNIMVKEDSDVISAQVTNVDGNHRRGELYVFLHFDRGGSALLRGYQSHGAGPLPMGHFEDFLSGRGYMRSVDLGDPAANAEYSVQTVPSNARWKIRGFEGTLVTDANVATRHFRIEPRDTSNVVLGAMLAQATQAAGATRSYHGNPSGTTGLGAVSTHIAVDIGTEWVLPGGFDLLFTTVNRQVGDDWGDGQLYVEEWIED